VSLEFLTPAATAVARSPMEREALAAGARIERRDGWNVAVEYDGAAAERERCAAAVGFADRSQLAKVELQAGAEDLAEIVAACTGGALELGRARLAGGTWWCPYSAERVVALCEPGEAGALRERLEGTAAGRRGLTSVVDVTAASGALTVAGPLATELLARFTAIDLRPGVTPVHGFRPGSVARTPGAILREDEQRWLMLFGAALGRYVWTVVADAAASLGGGPVGLDALEQAAEPLAEATRHA
jgi:heterotetrameric sarcosine oxidase gamma subunit